MRLLIKTTTRAPVNRLTRMVLRAGQIYDVQAEIAARLLQEGKAELVGQPKAMTAADLSAAQISTLTAAADSIQLGAHLQEQIPALSTDLENGKSKVSDFKAYGDDVIFAAAQQVGLEIEGKGRDAALKALIALVNAPDGHGAA